MLCQFTSEKSSPSEGYYCVTFTIANGYIKLSVNSLYDQYINDGATIDLTVTTNGTTTYVSLPDSNGSYTGLMGTGIVGSYKEVVGTNTMTVSGSSMHMMELGDGVTSTLAEGHGGSTTTLTWTAVSPTVTTPESISVTPEVFNIGDNVILSWSTSTASEGSVRYYPKVSIDGADYIPITSSTTSTSYGFNIPECSTVKFSVYAEAYTPSGLTGISPTIYTDTFSFIKDSYGYVSIDGVWFPLLS